MLFCARCDGRLDDDEECPECAQEIAAFTAWAQSNRAPVPSGAVKCSGCHNRHTPQECPN